MSNNSIIFIDSYAGELYGAQRSMLHLANLMKINGYKTAVGSVSTSKTLKAAKKVGINSDPLTFFTYSLQALGGKSLITKILITLSIFCNWFYSTKNLRTLSKYDNICFNDIRLFIYLFPILPFIRHKITWYVRIKENNHRMNDFFSAFCYSIALVSSDCIESFGHVKCDKVFVVNTGFDEVEHTLTERVSNSSIVINSVGSLCERKNQKEILEMFDTLSNDGFLNFNINLIGDCVGNTDDYKLELIDFVKRSNYLEERVNFLGFRDDVYNVLNHGDVFFFSSRREGLPRSVIEALKVGNYIISRRVEGIFDIVNNRNVGYIYTDNSHDSVNDIKSILNDLDNFNLKSKKQRSSFANLKFSNDAFVSSFEKCLK